MLKIRCLGLNDNVEMTMWRLNMFAYKNILNIDICNFRNYANSCSVGEMAKCRRNWVFTHCHASPVATGSLVLSSMSRTQSARMVPGPPPLPKLLWSLKGTGCEKDLIFHVFFLYLVVTTALTVVDDAYKSTPLEELPHVHSVRSKWQVGCADVISLYL